eukprot:scpid98251/ scgid13039/ 
MYVKLYPTHFIEEEDGQTSLGSIACKCNCISVSLLHISYMYLDTLFMEALSLMLTDSITPVHVHVRQILQNESGHLLSITWNMSLLCCTVTGASSSPEP